MSEEEKIENQQANDEPNLPIVKAGSSAGPIPEAEKLSTLHPQLSNEETMEVHTHPHSAHSKKTWKQYLWEFLMLFLAVFCGFIAENIREHSVEHLRVKQYARSLVHDLKKDTAMINLIVGQIQEIRGNIDSFAVFVKDRKMKDMRNIDLLMITLKSGLYRPYSWSRATIEQIKNSGSLRYFSNDSIINHISAYDALSKHLDEDFRGDEERAAQSTARKNQVIDQNYPESFVDALENKRDSMMSTAWFKELALTGPKLLTNDFNEIKIFLNEKISFRNELGPRVGRELPLAKKYATELIMLLKKEYHFE